MYASDEGGESGGRLSECNKTLTVLHSGPPVHLAG
jgi:hypothetical protein